MNESQSLPRGFGDRSSRWSAAWRSGRAAVVRRARRWPSLVAAGCCFTRSGALALAATRIGIAGLPQRWGASSVIVIGIAGVVGVLVAMLAMGEGFKATLDSTGSDATPRSSCAAVRRPRPTR